MIPEQSLESLHSEVYGGPIKECLELNSIGELHLNDGNENQPKAPKETLSSRDIYKNEYKTQKAFKSLDYVSVFRDDFDQKVIATPLNTPIATKSTFLVTEENICKIKMSEFDLHRMANLSIGDSAPDLELQG